MTTINFREPGELGDGATMTTNSVSKEQIETKDWQDIDPTEYDPDAPPSHSADNAAMFILDALAKQLGLETYNPADGSETWEGDVLGTMQSILVSAGVWDDYKGKLIPRASPPIEQAGVTSGEVVSDEMVELGAIALFQHDYPQDKWSKFGQKDYHPERYRAKARAALTAALSSLHAQPSGNSGELPDQGTGSREAVAWMHPTANWAHVKFSEVDIHCPIGGASPIPLVPLSQLQAVERDLVDKAAENNRNAEGFAFHAARAEKERAARITAEASLAAAREALTPSGDTKAAYMGEFYITVDSMNEEGEEESQRVSVPWTTIKEIMAAISARAALAGGNGEAQAEPINHREPGEFGDGATLLPK